LDRCRSDFAQFLVVLFFVFAFTPVQAKIGSSRGLWPMWMPFSWDSNSSSEGNLCDERDQQLFEMAKSKLLSSRDYGALPFLVQKNRFQIVGRAYDLQNDDVDRQLAKQKYLQQLDMDFSSRLPLLATQLVRANHEERMTLLPTELKTLWAVGRPIQGEAVGTGKRTITPRTNNEEEFRKSPGYKVKYEIDTKLSEGALAKLLWDGVRIFLWIKKIPMKMPIEQDQGAQSEDGLKEIPELLRAQFQLGSCQTVSDDYRLIEISKESPGIQSAYLLVGPDGEPIFEYTRILKNDGIAEKYIDRTSYFRLFNRSFDGRIVTNYVSFMALTSWSDLDARPLIIDTIQSAE